MNKRTIVSKLNTKSKILKLKVSAKKKEGVRRKLVTTASKLASTAKEKENVRSKLATTAKALAATAKALAVTAREKESIRRKLVTTANKLASTAREKESVRSKLAAEAKALAATAKEKESVRSKLATTAKALAVTALKLKKSYSTLEKKVYDRTKDLEVAKVKSEALFASIGEGVVAVDKNDKIILFNNKAVEMLGFREQEMLGKDLYQMLRIEDEQGNLIPEKERPMYAALSAAVYTNTTITKGPHYYYSRKNKTRIPVALAVSPVILKNNTIGAVEAFHDITEEKEIDKQKSEFISLASHQLRTPLGSMRWNLEILESEIKSLPQASQERLHQAYLSNLRVIRLVSDLLNIARIEQNRYQDEPELTNIVAIVENAVKEMEPEAKVREVTLSTIIKKPDIPKINIDPKRFREVIQNLLSNAVKYTLEGGKVAIGIDFTTDYVEISISDSGIGIPEKEKSKIFTKFLRATNAVRVDAEGSGMGLFIVKSYVEKWGGTIRFDSVENKGSTFYLSLPFSSKVDNINHASQ